MKIPLGENGRQFSERMIKFFVDIFDTFVNREYYLLPNFVITGSRKQRGQHAHHAFFGSYCKNDKELNVCTWGICTSKLSNQREKKIILEVLDKENGYKIKGVVFVLVPKAWHDRSWNWNKIKIPVVKKSSVPARVPLKEERRVVFDMRKIKKQESDSTFDNLKVEFGNKTAFISGLPQILYKNTKNIPQTFELIETNSSKFDETIKQFQGELVYPEFNKDAENEFILERKVLVSGQGFAGMQYKIGIKPTNFFAAPFYLKFEIISMDRSRRIEINLSLKHPKGMSVSLRTFGFD